MTSKGPKIRSQHPSEEEEEPDKSFGPPQKRRMTVIPPEPTSIFGGGTTAAVTPAVAEGAVVVGGRDVRASSRGASAVGTPKSPATGASSAMAAVELTAERPAADVDRRAAVVESRNIERLFSERIVEVRVGPAETIWRLHENLLSSASDFFRSAFNSGFKETVSGQLELPEDDPQAFELFVRWLYARAAAPDAVATLQGTAALFGASSSSAAASSAAPGAGGIQTYLRLYVLAVKLMVEDLENVCVDMAGSYYRVGTRRPDVRDVQFIYENTPHGSGMRRLLRERLTLGLFRGKQNNPVNAEWREVFNETPDLGFDVVSEIAGYHWIAGGNAPARAVSEGCVFHRHEKGEVCRAG